MIKKTITYTDYNGVERTEDFYFNLTKAELLEMDVSASGGMAERLQAIIAAKDVKIIGEVFKDILLRAYGVKSEDGRRFIKSKDITDSFVETEAYSELYVELATNAEAASAFIKGVIPDINALVDKMN